MTFQMNNFLGCALLVGLAAPALATPPLAETTDPAPPPAAGTDAAQPAKSKAKDAIAESAVGTQGASEPEADGEAKGSTVEAGEPAALAAKPAPQPLDSDALFQFLKALAPKGQPCFERNGKLPAYANRVNLGFRVEADGSLDKIHVISSDLKSELDAKGVEGCLSNLLASQTLPAPKEGETFDSNVIFRPVRFGSVVGSLSSGPRYQAAWTKNRAEVKRCWEKALSTGKAKEGSLSMNWTILPSGKVTDFSVTSSDLHGQTEVKHCIRAAYESMVFPPTEDPRPLKISFKQELVIDVSKITRRGKEQAPWGVNVGFGMASSMMVFSPTRYARSYYASLTPSLSVSGRLKLADKINATASLGSSFEVSTPNDPSGRRFFWSDPSIGISHSSIYKDEAFTGINLSAGAALSLGLSLPSLTSTQLFAVNGSLTASRGFLSDKLNTSLTVVAGVPFHRYSSPVVKSSYRDGVNKCLLRVSGAEVIGSTHCATGGQNTKATAGATLAVSYQATDKFGISASFGLMHSWSYAIKVDALSPKVLDSNGNAVADGTTGGDAMMGGLSASYRLSDRYALSAGFNTGGAPFAYYDTSLDSTNRALRFPFWDGRLMRTSFSIGASASF